jgi:hypothetical protein
MGGVFFSKSILGRGRGGNFFFLGGDFFFFLGTDLEIFCGFIIITMTHHLVMGFDMQHYHIILMMMA